MTIQRMIDLLKIEMLCVNRKAKTNCYGCEACDLVQDDAELQTMYASVIGVLESLTPHIMTLEEVHNWINADTMQRDPIFEETRGHDYGEWIDPFDDYDTADIVGYGESVRCWNTRPTDEQRKAAAWHEA